MISKPRYQKRGFDEDPNITALKALKIEGSSSTMGLHCVLQNPSLLTFPRQHERPDKPSQAQQPATKQKHLRPRKFRVWGLGLAGSIFLYSRLSLVKLFKLDSKQRTPLFPIRPIYTFCVYLYTYIYIYIHIRNVYTYNTYLSFYLSIYLSIYVRTHIYHIYLTGHMLT